MSAEEQPSNRQIYLDANASSRTRPEVNELIAELLADTNGNASSIHTHGRRARALIRNAAASLASSLELDSDAGKLVFTSSGTEACNLLTLGLLGGFDAFRSKGRIVCPLFEHGAVTDSVRALEAAGWEVAWIQADERGSILEEELLNQSLERPTDMVLLMLCNNETGVVQPVEAVAEQLRSSGYRGLICSDATQAFGKIDVEMQSLFDAGVDALVLSAHKLGAPAGTGCVIFSSDKERCNLLSPLVLGGPQQDRIRAGSENLLGIAAMAKAAQVISTMPEEKSKKRGLRNLLWEEVSNAIPAAQWVAGSAMNEAERESLLMSNTLMLRLPGLSSADFAAALDINGVSCSTGSACSSGKQSGSKALLAMGQEQATTEVLRLSLDWDADRDTILQAARRIHRTAEQFDYSDSGQSKSSTGKPGLETAYAW